MPPFYFFFHWFACATTHPEFATLAFPERVRGVCVPPGILYEYQNNGLTKFAIRN